MTLFSASVFHIEVWGPKVPTPTNCRTDLEQLTTSHLQYSSLKYSIVMHGPGAVNHITFTILLREMLYSYARTWSS